MEQGEGKRENKPHFIQTDDLQTKEVDLLAPTSLENYAKDIVSNSCNKTSKDTEVLKEQLIPQSLRKTIGDIPVSESRMQCDPLWLLDKSI